MTPEEAAWVERLERLRKARRPSSAEPTPGERRRFGHDAGELKRRVQMRNDATLRTMLEQGEKDLKKRRKDLAAAANAWRDTVEMHLRFPATLIAYQKGVLTVVVANHAEKYELDRVLRAGTRSHFEKNCRARVSQIRVIVGKAPEPVVGADRRTRTRDEAETELQELLDAGQISESDAGDILEQWAQAEQDAQQRDGRGEGKRD